MQIAIDTSTDTAGLALVQDGEIAAEMTWRCRQNHSVQLLPNLAHLLEQADLKIDTADCIFVARGPGSYNGLRVGISTAKGIAYSLDIPIIGVSTMEAAAYQHAATGLPVCAVFNAGRDEIGAALYQQKNGRWKQLKEERLTTVDALCSEIETRTVFCGEFTSAIAAALKKKLRRNAVIPSSVTGLRRAAFLAELGLKRFDALDYDDAASLQAFYFRGPPITPPKQKQNTDIVALNPKQVRITRTQNGLVRN